jgi:hypothetical protein
VSLSQIQIELHCIQGNAIEGRSAMKKLLATGLLVLLAACQSAPRLEDDTRYVRLARVVDVHEFTEAERKEAKLQRPGDSRVGVGVSIGVGSGGGFGGLMVGAGSMWGDGRDRRKEPPQVADGANRFTVQPLNSSERLEVMSYGKYKAGDCVKVLHGHPNEFPRLFDLKPGERCE